MTSARDHLIYLRKSRSDSPLETVEEVLYKHEKQLQDYAVRTFGEKIPEENIFREVVSGETIEDRPRIKEVLHRIELPDVCGVLIIEPQRLSRGDLVDCGTIIRAFKYTGTKIYTPGKCYDLADKYDEKFFRDELMRGNEYLEYTKEILSRGRLASISEGNYLGSVAPYGYDKTIEVVGNRKHPTLKINEDEAAGVRMIFDLYGNQNKSTYFIAQKLNAMGVKPKVAKDWTKDTLTGILKNVTYLGKVRWNHRKHEKKIVDGQLVTFRPKNDDYIVVEGKHEAIISQELFDKVQTRMGKNPRTNSKFELKNPLAGIMKCKKCGHAMTFRSGSGDAPPRLVCSKQQSCKTPSIRLPLVIDTVVDELKNYIADFEIKLEADETSDHIQEKQLEIVQKNLDDLEVQQERLFQFLENGTYDEVTFTKRNKNLAVKREELRAEYNTILHSIPKKIDYHESIVRIHGAIGLLRDENVPVKAKNDYLSDLIERIEYSTDEPLKRGGGAHFRDNTPDFTLDIFLRV